MSTAGLPRIEQVFRSGRSVFSFAQTAPATALATR
jgi:hypothetical protein